MHAIKILEKLLEKVAWKKNSKKLFNFLGKYFRHFDIFFILQLYAIRLLKKLLRKKVP